MRALFSRFDLSESLRRRSEDLRRSIGMASAAELQDPKAWEARFTGRPVELDETATTIRRTEDAGRAWIAFRVPFSGETVLLESRPSSYELSYPVGEVEGNVLVFKYESTDQTVEGLKGRFQSDLEKLKRWLAWSRHDVDRHKNQVHDAVGGWIQERLASLAREQALIEGLGYPEG